MPYLFVCWGGGKGALCMCVCVCGGSDEKDVE